MPKPIIVGYDPGITSAIAAVDLKGKFIGSKSNRNWSTADVLIAMREFGQPIIVSTDRSKASSSVEKLAAKFGCKLWTPQENLGVEEKAKTVEELLKDTDIEPNLNIHEEDATAAAVFAYKNFATQFSKIDDTLSQVGMEEHSDKVKKLLVSEEAKNINDAIEQVVGKPKQKMKRILKPSVKSQQPDEKDKKIKRLQESLGVQKLYIEKLERKNKDLEKSKQQLVQDQLKKSEEGRKKLFMSKDAQLKENMILQLRSEVGRLEKENQELQTKLNSRQEIETIFDSGEIPVIPVEGFSRDILAETDRIFNLKNKVLWIKNFSPSNTAVRYCGILRPKAVIGDFDAETEEKLRDKGIFVVKGLEVRMDQTIGAVDADEFERLLKSSEKKSFVSWLKSARKDIEVR